MALHVTEQQNLKRHQATFAAVLAAGGFKLTPSEAKQIVALDKQSAAYTDRLSETGSTAYRVEIERRQKAFSDDPSQANFDALKDADLNSAVLKLQFDALRASVKLAAKKHTHEKVSPVVIPILKRAADVADNLAAEIEAGERGLAEKFAVVFEPSATAKAIRSRAARLRDEAQMLARYSGSIGNASGFLRDLI